MNKTITKIIYGAIALSLIAFIFYSYTNNKEPKDKKIAEWQTYKNDELNIEVKHPANVAIEVESE